LIFLNLADLTLLPFLFLFDLKGYLNQKKLGIVNNAAIPAGELDEVPFC